MSLQRRRLADVEQESSTEKLPPEKSKNKQPAQTSIEFQPYKVTKK